MEVTKRMGFEFFGLTMEAFLTNSGKFILPLYEMCGILGLPTNVQVKHIKRDPALSDGLFYVHTMAESPAGSLRTRRIACLWVNCLPYWLGSIPAGALKPELREKISAVKRDLVEITWAYYGNHILPADVLRKISIETFSSKS